MTSVYHSVVRNYRLPPLCDGIAWKYDSDFPIFLFKIETGKHWDPLGFEIVED